MRGFALGPFQVMSPVGRGAMGEVWKGVHRDQRMPVAIKTLSAEVDSAARREAVFHELRAVAHLDHPGVIWIYDYGTIDEQTEASAKGAMRAGSPYLVMEFASRGSLSDVKRTLTWAELQTVFLSLLDALAHAHARGVIHRDLKPANILRCSRHDVRPGLKLADFGIAALRIDDPDYDSVIIGTPRYMAPEQLEGEARDQGAWTDLYALGCIAWRLITGRHVFHEVGTKHVFDAHLRREPKPLAPKMEVPKGIEDWLRILLAKQPRDRYRCAADAANALLIAAGTERNPLDTNLLSGLMSRQQLYAELAEGPFETRPATALPLGVPSAVLATAGTGSHLPPMPLDWRRPDVRQPPLRLDGVGRKLFALRSVPLVGRHVERTRLWESLKDVHASGQVQAIVIRGAPGLGASSLARWLGERAGEVGAAIVLRGQFAPGQREGTALCRMLAHRFGAVGLDPSRMALRLWSHIESLGVPTLQAEALGAHLAEEADSPRHTAAARVIRLLAIERPVVLVLDHADTSTEALDLALHLLTTGTTPILTVLTTRTERPEDATRGERLDALLDHPRSHLLQLGPLPDHELAQLLDEALALSSSLTAQLVESASGNPAHALQLLSHAVEDDRVVPNSDGRHSLAPNTRLPRSPGALWLERAAPLLEGLGSQALRALETGAVLGPEVDRSLWARATAQTSEEDRRELAHRLSDRGLATATAEELVFVALPFRDALLERAEQEGRLKSLHRSAADALAGATDPSSQEARGRHLLAAGRPGDAIDLLLEAIEFRSSRTGARSARALVDLVEEALVGVTSPDDRREVRLDVQLALFERQHGSLDDALLRMERRLGSQHPEDVARAKQFLAEVAMQRGEMEAARRCWVENASSVDPGDAPLLVARALFGIGELARANSPDEARQYQRAAVALLADSQEPAHRIRASLFDAEAALADHRMPTAAGSAKRALRRAREAGLRPLEVEAAILLVRVLADDPEAACVIAEEAAATAELVGGAMAIEAFCVVSRMRLLIGDGAGALAGADRALDLATRLSRLDLVCRAQSTRIAVLARLRRASAVEAALEATEWARDRAPVPGVSGEDLTLAAGALREDEREDLAQRCLQLLS